MSAWERTETARGSFWTCSDEQRADLVQVVSEQEDRSEHRYETAAAFGPVDAPPMLLRVEPGDVVLDLGAHIGVFTRIALDRGAARVVAVEPDPVSVESLRRTFEVEIADGRVVVVEVAAAEDCARGSIVGTGIRATVMASPFDPRCRPCECATVDEIVARLKLDRVDFIKLDVEGAEPWALCGAVETIRRFKPSIACCIYHHPNDPRLVVEAVRAARDDYTVTAGPVPPWMTTPVLYFFWR